eukprot:TRINITY_DN1827_c0_g1_i11.p1 TRINITY_DN1827_c0_g1~~TRINITY_DN1827_c0_g1_i11.p1  ORF type:complete len:165 (+),score=51.67 TRINITY_DN1827_c0_g1_i11:135-629(+)
MSLRRQGTLKGSKNTAPTSLPDDVLTDLKHVIEYLRKPGSTEVTRSDFRSIAHNFGAYGIRQSEFERELKKQNLDPARSTYTEAEVINMITNLWCTTGKDGEAADCFRVFDKKDKKSISFEDVMKALEENGIEYTSEDIDELEQELDSARTGAVTKETFTHLYY